MTQIRIAPYGSWKSPFTAGLISSATLRLEQVVLQGPETYWLESRPAEKGRYVVVRRTADGRTEDVTPAPFNVRSLVHEYGGASYVVQGDAIYFSNFQDQRIYRLSRGEDPRPISPPKALRYADGVMDSRRRRLIFVMEDHSVSGREAVNSLAALGLEGGEPVILAWGHDFYSWPRLSPDGSRLAWTTWDHPSMPWDGTELWVGRVGADGGLDDISLVAGGPRESVVQPMWSPEGDLYFVSDRSGWWNVYRWREGGVESMTGMEAEFARPQWSLGNYACANESRGRMLCSCTTEGTWRLALLDTRSKDLEPVDTPFTEISHLQARPGQAVFVGGSPTTPSSVVQVDLQSGVAEVLRSSFSLPLDRDYVSVPTPINFPTSDSQKAHAFFYSPRNRDFQAPEGQRPPLLVMSHGGPTSAASSALNLAVQYWTSRGFAVLDVNYRGSTGFGRDFRHSLYGRWGLADVDDCVMGALHLAGRGLADVERLAIRGGSAGGFCTLCALTFHRTFQAGASYYGISDLETLARETHKFESRYLDHLIGPYPERRDVYVERSPIHSVDRLSCPVIFFQGLEDRVVPPDQALKMVDALREKGLPVAYVAFPDEQHGFRQAGNIQKSLESELYFYSRIFGFELADQVDPVPIENLPGGGS
ncbi:MAG: S9 family peptidase [Methanosarcinales archaeon]|nr:S9 family peptidase [Methanosarcinales archaeon]